MHPIVVFGRMEMALRFHELRPPRFTTFGRTAGVLGHEPVLPPGVVFMRVFHDKIKQIVRIVPSRGIGNLSPRGIKLLIGLWLWCLFSFRPKPFLLFHHEFHPLVGRSAAMPLNYIVISQIGNQTVSPVGVVPVLVCHDLLKLRRVEFPVLSNFRPKHSPQGLVVGILHLG